MRVGMQLDPVARLVQHRPVLTLRLLGHRLLGHGLLGLGLLGLLNGRRIDVVGPLRPVPPAVPSPTVRVRVPPGLSHDAHLPAKPTDRSEDIRSRPAGRPRDRAPMT
ncbi:hypothetical protein GCM10009527_022790 [Actinomadura nitritigenes]